MNLFIFSEDLRMRDNKALYQASLEQKGLIALYIINKGKNEEHGDSLAKLKLKLLALAEIRNPLVSLNIPIKILHSQDIKDEPKEILGFCKFGLIRTLISKCVNSNETGKMFSFLAIIVNIWRIIGATAYRQLYNATLETFPASEILMKAILS